MLKRSNKGVDGNSSGTSGGIAMLDDQLPSEQDRKATLGCLAAILNITFASHERVDIVSNTPNTLSNAGESSGSLKSQGDDNKSERVQDDQWLGLAGSFHGRHVTKLESWIT